jgi:hypothetical protein
MSNKILEKITWQFIHEGGSQPSIRSYLLSVMEKLESLKPSSTADTDRVATALRDLKEVKRHVNKLEEELEKEKANSKDLEFKLKKYKEQLKNLKKEE